MTQTHEFNFDMACEGCLNAAKRVLNKQGVAGEDVKGDLPNKKLYVTSDKPKDELLEALQKTGKTVSYVGLKA